MFTLFAKNAPKALKGAGLTAGIGAITYITSANLERTKKELEAENPGFTASYRITNSMGMGEWTLKKSPEDESQLTSFNK
jgi:hypothetical protein